MTTAAEWLDSLHASLAAGYPVRRSLSARPGRVACVIIPVSGTYDTPVCDPTPVQITAEVTIIAAGMDEQSVIDLPHHLDPVAALIRAAGWTPTEWTSGTVLEQPVPVITITATVDGEG